EGEGEPGEGEGDHGGEGEGEPVGEGEGAGEGEGEGAHGGDFVAFITSPADQEHFEVSQAIEFVCAAHSIDGNITDPARLNWHVFESSAGNVEVAHFPGNHPSPHGFTQGDYKIECDLLAAPNAFDNVIAKDDNVQICVGTDSCQ